MHHRAVSWRQAPATALTVTALAKQLGLAVPAHGADISLADVRTLHEAEAQHLSFLDNVAYRAAARTTRAGAVLVRAQDADALPAGCLAIITPNPYASFAQALQAFYPATAPQPGRHESAVVSEHAQVHPSARLEPGVVVYADAVIGAAAHIGAHTIIGRGVSVGEGAVIAAHCTLHKTTVGNGCIIHPGVRIGQDGFGFAQNGETLIKVPQIGGVIIGNHVEIGANTTIDCGALGDTIIEDHVKIDNLVQIAHNVRIGRGTRIVAQTGIAGSSTLGTFNVIGGQSAIAGHLTLADRVMVAARSGIAKSITTAGAIVGGVPAVPIQEWRRQVAAVALLARRKSSN